MSKFPLYDSLSKDIPINNLNTTQKKSFIKRIEKIDDEGCGLVYALIKMYQTENNEDNTSFTLPYNGKYINNDMNFNLEEIPGNLQQILYKFLGIHLSKMREEKAISNQTPVKRM
jgi:hypothetical protein